MESSAFVLRDLGQEGGPTQLDQTEMRGKLLPDAGMKYLHRNNLRGKVFIQLTVPDDGTPWQENFVAGA